MSLKRLPYEVVSIITQCIVLEDVFHLALSCEHLRYLIRDDRSCKGLLEVSDLRIPDPPILSTRTKLSTFERSDSLHSELFVSHKLMWLRP